MKRNRFVALAILCTILAGCGAPSKTSTALPEPSPTGNPAGAANPQVSLSPTYLTFASTVVGATASALQVQLSNTGTATLTLTAVAVSGTNATDFAQTNDCGSSVAAGASCTINVTFKPGAIGTRTGKLSITDSASGSPRSEERRVGKECRSRCAAK